VTLKTISTRPFKNENQSTTAPNPTIIAGSKPGITVEIGSGRLEVQNLIVIV